MASRATSRLCCRGMRPARCAAAIASASRRRCGRIAELARHVDLVARRARRNHSPQRDARRAAAACRRPADGGDRCRGQRRAPSAPGAVAGWLTGFFANLPPRTLAVAASFAVLAIALQAFMLVEHFHQAAERHRSRPRWRRCIARHVCDGALCASRKRRRDHEFPAQLSGGAGRRSDRGRALSRAHRRDSRSPRKSLARSSPGCGRSASWRQSSRPPAWPNRRSWISDRPASAQIAVPAYLTGNLKLFSFEPFAVGHDEQLGGVA